MIHGILGLKGFAGVDNNGLSGDLALYWHESCIVEVVDKDDRCIDALVRTHEGAGQWRVTCVYGEPRVENHHLMWEKLKALKSTSDLPWLVIGDFNEALGLRTYFSDPESGSTDGCF